MLSRKYGPSHRIAVCERREAIPPSPDDEDVWSDVARFYLLGIGHRGQKALTEFNVFDDFEKASVAVNGRRDWQPGKTDVEDGTITPAKKDVVSRVLARDKLVGVLHHHIVKNYADANIDLLYGYEVDLMSFGNDDDDDDTEENDVVKVRVSKCEDVASSSSNNNNQYIASQDAEELCNVDDSYEVTTNFLIGADGSARTIANAMEEYDVNRYTELNPLRRLFAPKPFRVTRYVDDNPRVYKSVPICLPSDWPTGLNYSARSRGSRITLEALPSDDKGSLCALLLMKPEDELAKANVDPKLLRAFFDEEFPQFGALVDDEEMERVATKAPSTLPAFRYVGPRLNMGRRTIVLGDAAHTVKPYYGLGANTALEDVQKLSECLDEASANSKNDDDPVPNAVKLFSNKMSGDAAALVQISRNMDRPGKMFFVCFLLPIILDGIFHKMAPKIFGPNMFGMFQKRGVGFKQIQRKKRFDRTLQLACIGTFLTGMGMAAKAAVVQVAKMVGKSEGFVVGSTAAFGAAVLLLKKLVAAATATSGSSTTESVGNN